MRSHYVNGVYKTRLKVMAAILVLCLTGLAIRVAYIKASSGEYLSLLADELHNRERKLESQRGDIVDRNGVVLATSGSICRVSVVHNQIQDKEHTAKVLADILELDYEAVLKKVQKRVALQIIQNQVSREQAQRIREEALPGVMIDENYERYYPFGSLAAQTLGFVGSDNQGVVGLEVAYDRYLQGVDGRILSLTDARGVNVEGHGEQLESGAAGHVLQTTLDVKLQQYAEQLIEKAVRQKNAKKGALIAMNPQNGEIYAMALYPNFDLNTPFTIQDETLAAGWDAMSEAQQMEHLNQMWRNWCINDTYEPGSTFKIVTASAALEEGLTRLDEGFHCGGSLVVADRTIRCHKAGGHGSLTFLQGVQQSCNPVFMTLAARLGVERFYSYLKTFQFDQKTGIDVPGEATGLMHNPANVGPVELATMGFGQSLTITPMQLLRAGAAIVNGGTLITPHFGKSIMDSEGETVLKELTYKEEAEVISAATSETMRTALASVVSEGGGSKASIPGYAIGGKTATSQKLPRSARKYISSFLGFSPVEEAQMMVLCMVDEPEGIYYGGTVCAPIVKEFYENALPYWGVEPDYSLVDESTPPKWGEESIGPVGYTTAPAVTGMSYAEAKQKIEEAELEVDSLGSGEIVCEQFPAAGEEIRKGTKLIIYLEGDHTNDDRDIDASG